MSSTNSDDNINCTICLDMIKEDHHETICGHMYHKACLDEWLKVGSQCPLCRKDLGGVRQRVSEGYVEMMGVRLRRSETLVTSSMVSNVRTYIHPDLLRMINN